jgi:hypothetical protein
LIAVAIIQELIHIADFKSGCIVQLIPDTGIQAVSVKNQLAVVEKNLVVDRGIPGFVQQIRAY